MKNTKPLLSSFNTSLLSMFVSIHFISFMSTCAVVVSQGPSGGVEFFGSIWRHHWIHVCLVLNGMSFGAVAPLVFVLIRKLKFSYVVCVSVCVGAFLSFTSYEVLSSYSGFAGNPMLMAGYALGGLLLGGLFAIGSSDLSWRKKATVFSVVVIFLVILEWLNHTMLPRSYESLHASLTIIAVAILQALIILSGSLVTREWSKGVMLVPASVAIVTCANVMVIDAATSDELTMVERYTTVAYFTQFTSNVVSELRSEIDRIHCAPADEHERTDLSADAQSLLGNDPFGALKPTRNILFITVDAFRYNATSLVQGVDGPLAKWGSRGISFSRAYAPSPHTLTSMSSYMTLQHPSQLDIVIDYSKNWHGELDSAELTIADAANEDGWVTFSAVHDCHFRGLIRGIEQGFTGKMSEETNGDCATGWDKKSDDEVLARGKRFIDASADDPNGFFGWIFFVAPHHPYYMRTSDGAAPELSGDPGAYLSEVAYSEQNIDAVLKHLEGRGLLDETMVVITSDHGEATGEHGYFGHRRFYENELRVPFVVIHPDVTEPRVVDDEVQVVHALAWLLSTSSGQIGSFARRQVEGDLSDLVGATGKGVLVAEVIRFGMVSALFRHAGVKAIWSGRFDSMMYFNVGDDPDESFGSPSVEKMEIPEKVHERIEAARKGYVNAHVCHRAYVFGNITAQR